MLRNLCREERWLLVVLLSRNVGIGYGRRSRSRVQNAKSTVSYLKKPRVRTHPGFPEEELQVSATQDAVVLHIAGNVHGAGPVHGAVDLHIVVDGVQVFLFLLEQRQSQIYSQGLL